MNQEDFFKLIPIKLNEQQKEAVTAVNGPILLLAVPGSGKTTVLVIRLGYMVYCCRILPQSILTLTYTRAAARDMAERFAAIFGPESAARMEFRTINGICDRIIRFYGNQIGRAPFRLETDEKKLGKLLTEIYRNVMQDYPTENDIKTVRTLITYCKNMGLSSDEIRKLGEEQDLKLFEIYREYQSSMRSSGRMDYDDQMVYACNILKRDPGILQYFQQKYSYICVDEAQDTSKIQHEIIALLAADNENLFMVGDEDQSIYAFRAAWPEALLSFSSVHKGAKVLLLEQNFRSSAKIVRAANLLIRHNQKRYEKKMKAVRGEGADIRIVELKGRRAQYTWLLKIARSMTPDSPRTAVLYRNNENALPLIHLLEKEHVPYQLQSREMLFFTHRTVLDIRNIMMFAADTKNTELFMQIYYKTGLYINRKEAEEACRISRAENWPVLDVLERKMHLSGFHIAKIRAMRTNLERLNGESSLKALGRINKAMEYEDYLERAGMSNEKIGILRGIASNDMSVPDFLRRLDELSERIRNKESNPECPFILSTIHSAKGLEYDQVYLLDCMDGVLPKAAPEDGGDELEEERRLFYVAVTRARDMLTAFSLPEECLFLRELSEPKTSRGLRNQSGKGKAFGGFQNQPGKGRALPPAAFDPEAFRDFQNQLGAGIPVLHKKLGKGVVTDTTERNVRILFEDGTEKEFYMELLFMRDLLSVIQ